LDIYPRGMKTWLHKPWMQLVKTALEVVSWR
jgi:hypothetical protein